MGKGPSSSRVSTRTWTQQRPAASCSEGMVEICPTKLRMLSLQPGMHLCRRFQRDCRRARRCKCLALAKKSGVNFVGFVFNSFQLHSTTVHYTPLNYTTLRYTTLHYTTLPSTTLRYIALHYTSLHYNYTYDCTTTLHYTPLHET